MQLNQFFAPLNFQNLFIFLVVMLSFDSLGVAISKLLAFPKFLRVANWIFGLGIFIFVWFILHFFIPFNDIYIWISMLVLTLPTLPIYVKSGGPLSLLKELFHFPLPILFIIPMARPLFYILSLPPRIWDEMAYHFYSPARLITETSWQFTNPLGPLGLSFYDMIPRLLDTAFILMFSISKTYAIARLLHFLLFFSSIFAVGRFLQQKISFLAALVFSLLAIYISGRTLMSSTTGYIDAGAAAIALMYFVIMIGFVVNKERGYLFAGMSLFGIAIGIKYTTLTFLIPTAFLFAITFIILNHKKLFHAFNKSFRKIVNENKWILLLLILPLIFGGYWYIKNYIISGNPVYPFIFHCKKNIVCGQTADFFSGWAKSLDFNIFKNFVFQGNELLYKTTVAALFAAFFLSFFTKNLYVRIMSFLIPASIFLEFIIVRNYLGFLPRYFLHWTLLLPLSLALPFSISFKNRTVLVISLTSTLIFSFLAYQSTATQIKGIVNSVSNIEYVNAESRNYARGRMTIDEWIKVRFPATYDLITWCGEKDEMKTILVADPTFIWASSEGMMRIFLVNCRVIYLSIPDSMNLVSFTNYVKSNFNKSYIVSLDPCQNGLQKKFNDSQAQMNYSLNQNLICGSKLALPDKTNSILYRIGNQ